MTPGAYITHLPSAGDDQIVTRKKAILHRIIFGADVANGDVEVSDHASDGDANVKLQFTGSTLMTATAGGVDVGAVFENGISINSANQTKITVVWEPVA